MRAVPWALTMALVVATGATAHARTEDDVVDDAALPAHWRTIETAHFRIHFYEQERAVAERAAFIAERAHTNLTRTLDWLPGGKIDLTLVDHTDGANGYASSLPNNYIVGYGVPPEPLSTLNDFDDWENILISHELTHVVHLDTIIGLPRAFDLAFGKLIAPNLVQPNWFIEGLAVLMESKLTTGGRIRNALYDMYLRSAVLEDKFLSLTAVSNSPLVFPQGEAAYLYGSHFLKYIEDRYGTQKLTEISHRYGSNLLPFGLNRVAKQALGESYDDLWEDWHRALKRRYELQVEEVMRRGYTAPTRLTFEGEGPHVEPASGPAPHYFPDGRGVVYQRVTTDEHPAYVMLDPRTGARTELKEIYGGAEAVPTPDGKHLVFAQITPMPLPRRIGGADSANWEDLFTLDLASGRVKRLTIGQRAHEPDVSPDGRWIACTVGRQPGTLHLAIVPIEGGVPTVVVDNAPGEIAYAPAWSPDGKLIAYSRFKPGGFHDIHIYDTVTKTDRALQHDRAMDIQPTFSPDGKYVLWASDRTGIYNVFAYELATERVLQVTNVLSGAFQPAVAPDQSTLVFTGFSAAGYDVYKLPYRPESWALADPYVNVREDAPILVPYNVDQKSVPGTESAYQGWKYLYPRQWGPPTLYSDAAGRGAAIGVGLGVGDPVAIHAINLNLLVPFAGDPWIYGGYSFQKFWPNISFGASRVSQVANDLFVGGEQRSYLQRRIGLSSQLDFPVLRRTDSQGNLTLYYGYEDYGPVDPLPIPDPASEITHPPETGPNTNFILSWNYSNVRGWTQSISPQAGRYLQLRLLIADPAIASKFHTTQVDWYWTEYFTMPWAKLHVLAFLYAGGVGIGDKRSLFSLGGFQYQDLIRALFYQQAQRGLFLRGYPAGVVSGDQYHLVSMEYRAPILNLDAGHSTFPVYLRRIYGAVFGDLGNAFYGEFTTSGWRVGVGAELRLNFRLAYVLENTLQFGIAHGLSTGGVTDYYWVTSIPF